MKMPFGNFKGQGVENCPKFYLEWLLRRLYVSDPLAVDIARILQLWARSQNGAKRK